LAGIEISVEHAVAAAELELEARTFLDLECGAAEVAGEIASSHSGEPGRLALDGRGLDRVGSGSGLLGPGGAAGEEQDGSEK
jgi:hypothetical protein